MTQPTKEQQNADKPESPTLAEAVRIVNEAIKAERKRLEQIARTEEGDPIILEGMTSKDYLVQMMVDPAPVAKIMLDYEYPIYKVLGEEPSPSMWSDIAILVGLGNVISVDL